MKKLPHLLSVACLFSISFTYAQHEQFKLNQLAENGSVKLRMYNSKDNPHLVAAENSLLRSTLSMLANDSLALVQTRIDSASGFDGAPGVPNLKQHNPSRRADGTPEHRSE